jgi:RNA polymerase sigma-70 factor (ECF subfamily)
MNDTPVSFLPNRGTTRAARDRAPHTAASAQEARHDANLVRRFNGGEDSVFNEIVSRYWAKIMNVATTMLRNHADAEEIAQETFIRAHRGLAGFRGDSSLATWLHRIAVNIARNRYSYYFRRRRHTTLSLDCSLGDESGATFSDLVASEAPDPASDAAMAEFTNLVSECLAKLEPPQREILALRSPQNRSYDEIAQILGINVGTVKSRIARARANLLRLLAEACPEFGEEARPGDWFESRRVTDWVRLVCA